MYARRMLSILSGLALISSCAQDDKSKEKRLGAEKIELQQQIVELQAQIDAIGPEGAGLKEIQSKLQDTTRELEESRTLQDALLQEKAELEQDIADLSSDSQGAKILELRRLIREKESQLAAEQKNSLKLGEEKAYYDNLIKATLEPFWGLYISRDFLTSLDMPSCRLLVYSENNGELTRAIICRDGRMQWEKQQALTFDATVDEQLEGKYGFGVRAQSTGSSCTRLPSGLASSGDYNFERASSYGIASFSVGLRTDLNSQPVLLENAAIAFKSSDCEDLIARAANPGALPDEQREKLDWAGKFCRFKNGENPFLVGCFAESNSFIPFY